MTREVKKCLEEIKVDRIKRLMGLVVDLTYFDLFFETNNENAVRDELAEEEKKKSLNSKGQVIADNRDLEKVQRLNRIIDKISAIKNQRLQYKEVYTDLIEYTNLLNNPTDKLTEWLEQVRNL